MQWSREEGTAWDPKAPAAIITMKAGLDASNQVNGWLFKAKGFNGWDVRFTGESPEHVLVGMLTGHKKWNAYNFNVPEESYKFNNHVHWWETVPPYLQEASPMRTAHLRAPQEMQTRFGQESFIDEVAHAAGMHPVDFRLKHLQDPREIEVVIESMPQVAEVAVLGIPDDVTGEAVLALVVARMPVTDDDVLEFCSTRLARFKTPSAIRIVDSLPHSGVGKVAKGRLRDVYGDGEGEPGSSGSGEA
jgi:hypothetical protein